MKYFPAFLLVTLTSTTWSVAFGASIGVRSASAPQAPASPQMSISVSASLLSATVGDTGGVGANQQVEEHVTGDAQTPAYLQSLSGASAQIGLSGSVDEAISANPVEQTSGTFIDVSTQDLANSAADLQAHLIGGSGASVDHSGETYISGGLVIAATGNTANNLNNGGIKV